MNPNRIQYLNTLLAETPEDPFLYYALGLEYLRPEPEKAKEYFELVFSTFPEYLPNYFQLGTILAELDQKEKALDVFEKGVAKAKQLQDQHTLAELQSAYQNLLMED